MVVTHSLAAMLYTPKLHLALWGFNVFLMYFPVFFCCRFTGFPAAMQNLGCLLHL